eukprot:COSAG02_NODE_12317_length_1563_cov_9.105295_1_plen_368_part_01
MVLQRPCPLRATRQYSALESVSLPAPPNANAQLLVQLGAPTHAADAAAGPLEHAVDAFHLRNEGSIINDFRDDVTDPNAAHKSSRRPNCAVVPVVIAGQVHALCYTTKLIAKGREVLMDYGEEYWQPWNGNATGAKTSVGGTALLDVEQHMSRRADGLEAPESTLQMEAHDPLDRNAARELTQGDEWWDWADSFATVPLPALLQLSLAETTCATSVAALHVDQNHDSLQLKAELPAHIHRLLPMSHRDQLVEGVRTWLSAGAGAQNVVIGRLISSTHPAVVAAEQYASSRSGVAAVQLGLFAQSELQPCTILCEYQGVRISWPIGCSPWSAACPVGRTSYLLGITQAEHLAPQGIRQSLAQLPMRTMS